VFVRPFRYERARSLHDACAMLRAHGDGAKAIAGGQSLLPMVNLGLVEPDVVVDLSRAEGPRGVLEDEGHLRIGALTRHRELERDGLVREHQPLLAAAVRNVGSPRIRVRGTLGGSLAHSDPAAELPLAMTLLGADYEVTDGESQRTVPAGEFHVSYFTTALAEDELLLEVRVPKLGPGWGWGFVEVSRRPGDFALVAVAALVRAVGAEVVEARVALGGVAERPVRSAAVEMAIAGARPGDVDRRVGPIEGIEPVGDTGATPEHRRHLARVLVVRALEDALARAGAAA
jgi:aerobic carbon-monoxide dehydrogenase medium subunit